MDVERYLDGRKPVSVAEQPAAVSLSPLAEDDIVVELARTLYCMGREWKRHVHEYISVARSTVIWSSLRFVDSDGFRTPFLYSSDSEAPHFV